MNVTISRRGTPPAELIAFARGDPVGPHEVEQELTGLWRKASEELQGAGHGALPLASLWTLVTFHSGSQNRVNAPGEVPRIQGLLEQVTTSVPARVIHLEEWRDRPPPDPERQVEARVGTNCLLHADKPKMVCLQEITLAGYGEQGLSHFPALVRALLLPDLPVALLWLDEVPQKGRLLGQLLQLSDRLLIDTQRTLDPVSLLAVNDLLQFTPVRVVDLGWMRLTALRHLLADFFDPPGRAEQLARLESVLIETSPMGRNTGFQLLGWLLSRCGYDRVRAVDLGGTAERYRWHVEGEQGVFPMDFRVKQDEGGLDGIICIEIQAGGDTFALHDVDPEHMAMKGPDREVPSVALREWDDAGLIVNGLGGGGADRVFGEAMAMAARLADTEQWNR